MELKGRQPDSFHPSRTTLLFSEGGCWSVHRFSHITHVAFPTQGRHSYRRPESPQHYQYPSTANITFISMSKLSTAFRSTLGFSVVVGAVAVLGALAGAACAGGMHGAGGVVRREEVLQLPQPPGV